MEATKNISCEKSEDAVIRWFKKFCKVARTSMSGRPKIVDSEAVFQTMKTVMWSTTERREIRNFYYPSVFELAGRQRLTVEREIRNVGQLRPAVEGRKECRSIPRGRSNKSRSEWKPTDVCILWPERRSKRLNDWPEP